MSDAEERGSRYEMVYRCQHDLDPFGDGLGGCSWWTTHYDEIDGHENQLEPGHYVIGQLEWDRDVERSPADRRRERTMSDEKSERDVEALVTAIPVAALKSRASVVRAVLTSDWLAQRDDQMRREGAANARAAVSAMIHDRALRDDA